MSFAHHLPGNDVRVVLHAGDQHLIALLQKQLPQAERRQVQTPRRATGEDHLVRMPGVDVPADGLPRGLLRFGGLGAQRVYAPVHVGVDRGVVGALGLDHAARLLAGRSVVEVHQRLAVHQLLQDGELCAELLHVEDWFEYFRFHSLQSCSPPRRQARKGTFAFFASLRWIFIASPISRRSKPSTPPSTPRSVRAPPPR